MEQKLTNEQSQIINFEGSCFVRASAGSGKTTTVIEKIKYSVEKNKSWKRIAYITFLRKAADEGKKKMQNKIRDGDFVGTYDEFISREILPFIKNIVDVDSGNIKVSYSKEILLTFEQGIEHLKKYNEIAAYVQNISKTGRSFLTELCIKILTDVKISGYYLSSKYFHIFNDEFQDYNSSQLDLIEIIFNKLRIEMTFVGDFKQSIYSFRGANPSEINKFIQNNKITVKELSFNFRCHESINNFAMYIRSDKIIESKSKQNKVILWPSKDLNPEVIKNLSQKFQSLTVIRKFLKNVDINDYPGFVKIQKPYYLKEDKLSDNLLFFLNCIMIDSLTRFNLRDGLKIDLKENEILELQSKFVELENFEIRKNKKECVKIITSVMKILGDETNEESAFEAFEYLNNTDMCNFLNQDKFQKTLQTVHGCKGLEFDNVVIFLNDFSDVINENKKSFADLHNLHYVAVTRAINNLIIVGNDEKYIQKYRDWLSKFQNS